MQLFGAYDHLSADDLRAMALMLGASDLELAPVLSRDRLIDIVAEYAARAVGQPGLTPGQVDIVLQSALETLWPGPGSLEKRARRRVDEGLGLLLRLASLVASSDGVMSRLERRFLTESAHLLGSDGLAAAIPRKAVSDVGAIVDALEPDLRRLGVDQEAMRAALSLVAGVAVVDEVLRRPEIDLYYRLAELMGEDRKEAAILLEEVRRSYGLCLQSVDPVAAGPLSNATAAALAAAERAGFGPFLSSHPGLRWLGTQWYGPAEGPDLPNCWPAWAAMLGALGVAVALAPHRGTVRYDRLLPWLLYRARVVDPAPPAPVPEFTIPPW